MHSKTSLNGATLLVAIGLAACGGGGSDPVASTVTFPVDAAQTAVLTSTKTYSAAAVDGSSTWTLSLTASPVADEVFEGSTSKVASISLTVKKNGATNTATSYKSYFSVSPLRTIGARYSDGTYAVQTQSGSYPTTATVGQTGNLGVLTLYNSSAKTTVLRTSESTWSLEADTSTSAYLCVNSVVKAVGGAVEGTSAGCFQIDTAGTITGIRWTLAVDGKTLVFK